MHHQRAVPVCLRVASVCGAESIILSAGGTESMMLSVRTESMDPLSASTDIIILSASPPESMILSALFGRVITPTAAATKTTTNGNTDDRQFMTIVNSASTAALIGLPPKMAKFCHTSNRLLVGCQRCCALLRLYFNSSAVGRSLVVGHLLLVGWWVQNENCYSVTFGGDYSGLYVFSLFCSPST